MKTKLKWQDWINLVAGLWIFVSPWALQQAVTTSTAVGEVSAGSINWNLWIVGLAVATLALIALFAFQVWEEWVNVGLGLWLIASPWILGFSTAALLTWNAVIIGVLIAVVAGWALVPAQGPEKHSS
jgi:SPW repeat-containing protein